MDCRKLNTGCMIPVIGFGTGIAPSFWQKPGFVSRNSARLVQYAKYVKAGEPLKIKNDLLLVHNIKTFVENSGGLVDTSRAYGGSEKALGMAIKDLGREKVFVCTKMSNYDQRSRTAREAVETSLQCLGTDYIDLYLLHWPQTGTWQKAWKQLERLHDEGMCKAIGVSNFNVHHLEELSSFGNVCPAVDQFECHPLFTQCSLRKYCHAKGIQVMAYSPTATMDWRLAKNATLERIARQYGKSISQVILRWHLEVGNIPVMHSSKPKHIMQNLDVLDFRLTCNEVDSISNININARTRYDPDNCDFFRL